jgi:hypothetical protein
MAGQALALCMGANTVNKVSPQLRREEGVRPCSKMLEDC